MTWNNDSTRNQRWDKFQTNHKKSTSYNTKDQTFRQPWRLNITLRSYSLQQRCTSQTWTLQRFLCALLKNRLRDPPDPLPSLHTHTKKKLLSCYIYTTQPWQWIIGWCPHSVNYITLYNNTPPLSTSLVWNPTFSKMAMLTSDENLKLGVCHRNKPDRDNTLNNKADGHFGTETVFILNPSVPRM